LHSHHHTSFCKRFVRENRPPHIPTNLEHGIWQLCGKISIFCEDFGSSILCLSLTVNVEPGTCERLHAFITLVQLTQQVLFVGRVYYKGFETFFLSQTVCTLSCLSFGRERTTANPIVHFTIDQGLIIVSRIAQPG